MPTSIDCVLVWLIGAILFVSSVLFIGIILTFLLVGGAR